MNPQSLNRCAYVLNNPTSFVDPLGLTPCTDTVNPDLSVTTNCTVSGNGPPPGNNPLWDLATQGGGAMCNGGTGLCGSSLIINFKLPYGCRILGNPIREVCASSMPPPKPAPPLS